MAKKEKTKKIPFIRILLRSVREYKKASILTPLFVAFEVLLECVLPLLTSELITTMDATEMEKSTTVIRQMLDAIGLKGNLYGSMIVLVIALLVIAFGGLAFGFLSGKYASIAATGFAKNLRHDIFYKTQDFSFENIDKFSASSLITRMTTDIQHVQMAYGMIIRIAVRSPLMLVVSIVMSFTLNWKIATIILCFIPLMGAGYLIISCIALPLFSKLFKKYDKMNESVQENVSGIRVVKSYVREEYEKEKFANASDEIAKNFTRAERIVAANTPIMGFFMHCAMIVIAILGAYLITTTNQTEIKIANLQALLTYNVQMLTSVMILNMIIVMINISLAAMKRIAEVLVEEPTITNPENPVYEVKDGSIEFKNVSFKYSKAAEKNALSNINLSIPSGATVGIIGGTGSSKTTLVNLISRLYDVTEGELLVGGVNVKNYDLKTLRDEVSVVLQKNVLFSGTIASNLRWGKEDATDEEVKHVADLACATEFVERHEEKFEKYITQGGTNVSGGQKQRLCIARALLKNPKILILDDSTSAVDTKTDAIIRKGFKEYIPSTTKIIIAQRIHSVEDADIIIVMDNGEINGMGTNDELLKTNKIYQEVYEIQNRISANPKGGELNA